MQALEKVINSPIKRQLSRKSIATILLWDLTFDLDGGAERADEVFTTGTMTFSVFANVSCTIASQRKALFVEWWLSYYLRNLFLVFLDMTVTSPDAVNEHESFDDFVREIFASRGDFKQRQLPDCGEEIPEHGGERIHQFAEARDR